MIAIINRIRQEKIESFLSYSNIPFASASVYQNALYLLEWEWKDQRRDTINIQHVGVR
jgi:hypothetical protein